MSDFSHAVTERPRQLPPTAPAPPARRPGGANERTRRCRTAPAIATVPRRPPPLPPRPRGAEEQGGFRCPAIPQRPVRRASSRLPRCRGGRTVSPPAPPAPPATRPLTPTIVPCPPFRIAEQRQHARLPPSRAPVPSAVGALTSTGADQRTPGERLEEGVVHLLNHVMLQGVQGARLMAGAALDKAVRPQQQPPGTARCRPCPGSRHGPSAAAVAARCRSHRVRRPPGPVVPAAGVSAAALRRCRRSIKPGGPA